MGARDQLRAMLATTPEGVTHLTLSVPLLRDALASEEPTGAEAHSTTPVEDLTIDQVAQRVHRAPSTVRGWLNGGEIPEAYKLRGRDWRIPLAALQAFLRREAEPPAASPARRGRATDLRSWRTVDPSPPLPRGRTGQ